MQRRDFLKTAAIYGAAIPLPSALAQERPMSTQENDSTKNIPLTSSAGTRKGDMLYRRLGRTGERVSAIGLGGFHIAQQGLSEDESVRLVCTAIDRGITFRDNSWDYNGGRSQLLMGKALRRIPLQGLFDDEDRRTHKTIGAAADRDVMGAFADGSHRSRAAS